MVTMKELKEVQDCVLVSMSGEELLNAKWSRNYGTAIAVRLVLDRTKNIFQS